MITYHVSNKILNHIFCTNTNSTSNSSINLLTSSVVYLGLSTTEPSPEEKQLSADGQTYEFENWNVTEPPKNMAEGVTGGYERKLLAASGTPTTAQLMGTVSNGYITNAQEIHFNVATASWGTLQYACIFDAKTNGKLVAYGELGKMENGVWVPTPITPTANTVVVIPAEGLRISVQ